MNIVIYLRQFRIGGFAIFDFAVAFLGIFLLSPLLTKLFRKLGIEIPIVNWIFLTLPIGLTVHLLIGNITPMTRNFIDPRGYYILKILIVVLLIIGLRGIKKIKT